MDTGATDSLVPRSCIESICLEPDGQRVYETADGREIRMDFTRTYIKFMGDVTTGRIIIGDEGVEPLLEAAALESTGIEVDPVNQRLKRLPVLRLKRVARTEIRSHPVEDASWERGRLTRMRAGDPPGRMRARCPRSQGEYPLTLSLHPDL